MQSVSSSLGSTTSAARTAGRFRALVATCWRAGALPRRRSFDAEGWRFAARELHELARSLCDAHGVELVIRGPLPPPGCVVAANHLGYLDTIVLPALGPATCIAKQEVARWPFIGPAARSLGIIFVERGNAFSGAMALRRAQRALEAGVTVMNFPEGTTSCGDAVLPLHRGLFGIARRLGTPVVPATLSYARELTWVGDDPFLPHYLRLARRTRISVRITLGPPLDPAAYPSVEALTAATGVAIRRALPSGAGPSGM